MKNFYKNEQSGRSMIEMLGVLAIIGVLSVGGIAGYSKAMAKFKISKTLDQISMLVTNIRTFYGNQATFTGLTPATAISYDLASADMSGGSTSKLFNPFGGAVNIVAVGATSNTFTLTYEGLDKQSCMAIAMADWGSSAGSGLVSLSVAGTLYSWGGAKKLPVTLTDAANECKDGTTNILIWTYN